MTNDQTLQRIWKARQEIYARCGNDPLKLIAHYIERQKENPRRLLQTIREGVELRGEIRKEPIPAHNIEMEASI